MDAAKWTALHLTPTVAPLLPILGAAFFDVVAVSFIIRKVMGKFLTEEKVE